METKIEKIRKRKSYQLFKDFLLFLREMPTREQMLSRIYQLLDSKNAWGSEQNSYYAKESLNQLIQDEKLPIVVTIPQ